ncbi:MAG TPA: hypothetical protein VN748_04950 [Pseudonocardiaceae bacterium]|jgi:hypothetical protein|nr:hypothetical protein [Pseudonocardiaceae bacterium]
MRELSPRQLQGAILKEEEDVPVMDYRTRDGLSDYGFSIEHQPDNGWRVYVIFHPFRQGDNTLNLPYEAIDNKGRRYIDWPGNVDSLGEARTVAGLWAELVEPWRRTQEQRTLYVELIERYLQTQERRMAAVAGRDLISDAVESQRPHTVRDEVA